MLKVTSAGMLLFRETPNKSFLLLKSKKRWDVPKGHVETGESELEAAVRELREETEIRPEQVRLEPDFRFQTGLQFRAAYLNHQYVDKTYVVFLGYVEGIGEIRLHEHTDYQWFAWDPPHHIQKFLIDPLLQEVSRYFEAKPS